jgi:hypothetical protein
MQNIPKKNALTKELAIILALKILLLIVIWYVCFSTPPDVNDNYFVSHIAGEGMTRGKK